MLQATVMGDHMHAQSIRPDRIIRTGVIEPYPASGEFNPVQIARRILEPFATLVPSTVGPQTPTDPSPEEIVEQARNYARAVDQGIMLPPWLTEQALRAIQYLREGKTFVVKAQGRALLVKPTLNQTSAARAMGAAEIEPRPAFGAVEIEPRAVFGTTVFDPRQVLSGPHGSSLPNAPVDLIQSASGSRLGPPSTLLRTATDPGRRQAAERQVYYLSVR